MSKIQKKQLQFILKHYFTKYDIEEMGTIWVDLDNVRYTKQSTVRDTMDRNLNEDGKSNKKEKSSEKKKEKSNEKEEKSNDSDNSDDDNTNVKDDDNNDATSDDEKKSSKKEKNTSEKKKDVSEKKKKKNDKIRIIFYFEKSSNPRGLLICPRFIPWDHDAEEWDTDEEFKMGKFLLARIE